LKRQTKVTQYVKKRTMKNYKKYDDNLSTIGQALSGVGH